MMSKDRSIFIGFAYTLAILAAVPAFARPLPSDTRNATGTLDNGFRWIYRQHGNPPGKLSLMLHVNTGSLNETDKQRGLAHFMEHMVFNGTEHFAPGTLLSYFESRGMQFGGDANASTSFDRTGYILTLPKNTQDEIDKAMMVLSDYAFRALLNDKEIDKERGVILEEARSKKSADQRIRDALWPELYAGSRFAQRLPIGDPDVVANAPRSEFLDYYRAWYRPDNMTLIVVGDADPKSVVPLITKWFGEYKPEVPPRKRMGPELKPFTAERAFVMTDPEVTTAKVQMLSLLPGRPPAVTVEQRRAELVEDMASRALGRRFDDRVKKGQAGYRTAEAGVGDFFHDALIVGGEAIGDPADWARMLDEMIVEVSRAREHGFTDREMKLLHKELIASAEQDVRTESTQNAKALTQKMFNAVNDGVPMLSAQQELDLLGQLVPSISAAEVSETFKKQFAPGTFAYVVTLPGKSGVAAPAKDDVLAAARAAWARKVEAPQREGSSDDLLPSLPAPGKFVETTEDKELGIVSAWLENGVRVHHRFMDYKKDSVMVSISLAGGGIEETADNVGVSLVAGLAISNSATRRLDSTSIRDLMVGKNAKVGGGPVGDDMFVVRVAGSPGDLESGLKLAYALLTDGKIEETAFKNWKLSSLRDIEKNQSSTSFRAGEAMTDLLSGGDVRRLPLKRTNIEALSVERAQAWFDRLCREAPIEVTVVGDLKWDDARPLLERYVGSLAKRNRDASHLDKLRTLARGAGPLRRKVEVETVTPTAVVYAGFAGCQGSNVDDRRALQVASIIATSQLIKRVREELSLVYGIDASSTPSWIYRDAGRFQAGSKCKPENAEQVAAEVQKIFNDFAERGPTKDELENARKQILNQLDTSMREPMHWVNLLEHLDLRGRSLDEAKNEKAAYAALTADQVQAAFHKYCTPKRSYAVIAVPAGPAKRQENSQGGTSAAQPAGSPASR